MKKGAKKEKSKNTERPPAVAAAYAVILKVNGEKLAASGETPERAISALKMPEKFGTKAVFTLERDGKSSLPVPLRPWQAKRLSAHGMSGEVQRAMLVKRMMLSL